MADCFNCIHRHNMICIPESNDCEKVYLLDDKDVFETNNEKCSFYNSRNRIYDYSTFDGSIRYTHDLFDMEIDDKRDEFSRSYSLSIYDFKHVFLNINGIIKEYSRINLTITNTRKMDNDGLTIFEITIGQKFANGSISNHHIFIHCKCITIHKEKDMFIINGIRFLGEEE